MSEKLKEFQTSAKNFHTTTKIVSASVKFSIPKQKWLAVYSMRYPKLQFSILSMMSISEKQGNCLLQIVGGNLDTFWRDFSQNYDPKKIQVINKDETAILINIIHDSPWIIWTLFQPQVIILYPIAIQKGKISMNLIAPTSKVDEVFQKAIWKDLKLKVSTISNYISAPQLNPHQVHILTKALDYGLFDIPRKKSLTEATELMKEESGYKISVSALSENIRRINKKFAESFLSCSETNNVETES